MKLRHLHIENYKMFKDFDISFVDEYDEPLPIVVLAGVNGSGKTTLLEFLKGQEEPIYESEFGYLNPYGSFDIEYLSENIKYKISVKKMGVSDKDFFPEKIEYLKSGIDDVNIVAEEFVKSFYFFLKEKDYRPSEVREHFESHIQDIFDGLDLGFKYSHLDRDDYVWFVNDNQKELKIHDLSTGEKTLLSKILYLYFKGYKDKVVLIDEPELSLHPSWQNRVLKIYENFAKQNNCQIIIATHSPHIIGSAKAEYIRLLKKEDDKVVAIENIDRSYGLEFDKILTDIMGVENLRTPAVAKDIRRLWDLLEDENYESEEYTTLYDDLEKLLGSLDEDLLLARLEIAKIKSQNAKSE